MKRLLLLLIWSVVSCVALHAAEFDSLESIGDITNYSTTARGVVFNCRHGSQVQITVLAADLVRVRASMGKPLPARDHSWAIAQVNWQTADWQFREDANSFSVVTSE